MAAKTPRRKTKASDMALKKRASRPAPSPWRWLVWLDEKGHPDGRIKGHAVHVDLLPYVLKDLKDRDIRPPERVEPLPEAFFDMPGMCFGDRPVETFDFCFLKLKMPSEDILAFIYELKHLKFRKALVGSKSEDFTKLHVRFHVLCLTRVQHKALVVMLELRAVTAEEKSRAFYQRKGITPAEALVEAGGVVRYGDKHARFKPENGQ